MPRRSAKPPYEIMSGSPAGPGGAAPPRGPRFRRTGPTLGQRLSSGSWGRSLRLAIGSLTAGLGAGWAGLRSRPSGSDQPLDRPWWITSSAPVTLRIPKGLFVGCVAGVVALIGLAFWFGLSQGRDSARVQVTPLEGEGAIVAFGALSDIPGGADGTVGPLPRRRDGLAGTVSAAAPPPDLADPRVPGFNYLVYITTIRTEAERVQRFLAEQGVVTILAPVGGPVAAGDGSGHTTRLFRVIDVSRGFSPEQYRRGEHRAFHNARLKLGLEWKRHNGNRGDDLSSMIFYKYDPAS